MKGLIVLLIILYIVFSFQKMRLYYINEKEKELVAWCVTKDSSSFRANLSLSAYVLNAQIRLNIPTEYRISSEKELSFVNNILQKFQEELEQNYFNNRLLWLHGKYDVLGEHYFMFALNDFLERHQCDRDFDSFEMHQDTILYKSYGSWGGTLFDATYSLTDFSVAYHKLYYTSYLFCKDSEIINPKGQSYRNDSGIKEILDTKQIQISRC